MKTRHHDLFRTTWAISMAILLAMVAFAQEAGQLVQRHHRSLQQAALRRSQTAITPVRVVLADTSLAGHYFQQEKLLVGSRPRQR